MLSNPLELKRHLTGTQPRFSTLPFVDVVLLGLFFVIISSRFVFFQGVPFDLATAQSGSLSGLPVSSVLTVRQNQVLIFEGEKVALEHLVKEFEAFLEGEAALEPVLLVRVHPNVPSQDLIAVCDAAKAAGFRGVQLAAQGMEPVAGRDTSGLGTGEGF